MEEVLNGDYLTSMTAEGILRYSSEHHASDIHLAPNCPLMIRIDGMMTKVTEFPLSAEMIERVLEEMIDEEQWKILEDDGELDCAYSCPGYARVRVNAFKQRGGYSLALRILSVSIPTPQQLGLPNSVVDLTNRRRGLVLVTGATGSGKSTTLASLIHIIATTFQKNIITLEDPIEYLHDHSMSMVTQREIGSDSASYASAVRAALREDPDVILVGEMRDLETISTAITAAETGHLVFSTLHTNSAADAVDRVIDVFPPHQQQQIRIQFAGVIEGIIAQQLLPRKDGGRSGAFEVLIANSAIRNLIREGKSFQIPTMIQTGRKEGMQAMDDCIYDLLMSNHIDRQTAIAYAQDQPAMERRASTYY